MKLFALYEARRGLFRRFFIIFKVHQLMVDNAVFLIFYCPLCRSVTADSFVM